MLFFSTDWFDLLAVQGTLKSLLQHQNFKASILWHSAFFTVQLSHPYITTRKTIALTAATAKSLQSCPTLCDPIDGSPPGSPIPGILQARTLEWGAIAVSSQDLNLSLSSNSMFLTVLSHIATQTPESLWLLGNLFLVAKYGRESWTIKKAECLKTDAFEL